MDPMALRRCELFRNTSNHPIRIKTEELDFAMCVGYVLVQGSLKEFSEICSIFIPFPQERNPESLDISLDLIVGCLEKTWKQ